MRRIIYPQFVFSREIRKKLIQKSANGNSVNSVLDCPCGSGITTFNLAKWFPRVNFIGVDLDKEAISFAKSNNYLENLNFFHDDILKYLKKSPSFNIICLINSLFLFEDPLKIMSQLRESLAE